MTKQTVKTVKTQAAIVALPEFDSSATTIVKAYEKFDKASEALDTTVNATMQAYIDQCNKAGLGKDKADVDRLGKMIRDSQVVLDIVALGAMPRKTFTEYAQSAMRAFFHGVPFYASLKNDKDMGLPWGGAKGDKQNASGVVVSTTREALDKTISKALEQARALGLLNFAAELVDLATESLDGFSE